MEGPVQRDIIIRDGFPIDKQLLVTAEHKYHPANTKLVDIV